MGKLVLRDKEKQTGGINCAPCILVPRSYLQNMIGETMDLIEKKAEKMDARSNGNDIDYITQSEILSDYNWTKTMVEKFLPEPTRYHSAAPMKLWDRNTVLAAMETEDFQKAHQKAEKRRLAGKKAAQARTDKTSRLIDEKIAEISVIVCEDGDLEQRVIDDKCERNMFFSYDYDKATMLRWKVNYIRHNLTSYDDVLYRIAGQPGCQSGYHHYKEAVLDAIADAYPAYKEECIRQKERMVKDLIARDSARYARY